MPKSVILSNFLIFRQLPNSMLRLISMKDHSKISRWLNLAVFGANDGIITTFAVVAGVSGARLSPSIVLILGLANIVADALSMSLGNYLGEKSENRLNDLNKKSIVNKNVIQNSFVIFVSFMIAGLIPLFPYLLNLFGFSVFEIPMFTLAVIATSLGLFLVGSLRTFFTKGVWWKNGMEMFLVGSIAATVAYVTGYFVEKLV